MAMIGLSSSRELNSAASILPLPSRMWRATFSTTTMASSTTKPTDKTTANIVNKFKVKPINIMAAIDPMIEIGMATNGTRADLNEPINNKTTSPTKHTVSNNVVTISLRASRIYRVPS